MEYEIVESETEESSEVDHKLSQNRLQSKSTKNNEKSSIIRTENNVIAAMTEARRRIDDALVSMKALTSKRQIEEQDEYDLFAQVIASKLRKIQNLDERETAMHSLYNVVYEALQKNIWSLQTRRSL